MDGRDAFGRKTGEDPLATMGLSEDAASTPRSPVPTPAARPRRAARGLRLGIVLVFFAVLAGGTLSVLSAVNDTVDGITLPALSKSSDGDPAKDRPSTPPEGFAKGSLLLRGNLSPALR